jgi:uncharacterized membrane protein
MKHPVHPLIVHFPIACWSLGTLGDLTGILFSHGQSQAIGLLIIIGCISAVIAMTAGLYDLGKVKDIQPIERIVDRHMYAAVIALSFYSLSLYLRWSDDFLIEPNKWAIVTSIIGFISLIIAGWYGASLVYVYDIGTKKR